MSLLHSDYHIASFATPPKKTKFNAFTNKNQAYELNIYLSLYLFCCVVVGRYSNCNYMRHLNFEAAVSLVCSSLQISVLRIGAVIFYSFFVQHMRRARNWWDSSLVCFVNSSRVEDTSRLWCKKEDKQLYILVVNWISNWLTFYYAIGSYKIVCVFLGFLRLIHFCNLLANTAAIVINLIQNFRFHGFVSFHT